MPERRLCAQDGRRLAKVRVCSTWRSRRRGLLGTTSLPRDECILLVPCRAIHTIGMKMSIDVAYLDRELTVLAVDETVPPWRLLRTRRPLKTRAILEAAAGAFSDWGLRVGERLAVA